MTITVGLVGCGIMGRAIAAKLVAAGYRVQVYDNDRAALDKARELGCRAVKSPADVARQAEVILISLPRPEHVTDVVVNGRDCLLSTAADGAVIVDTSTVDPETTQRNSAAAMGRGVGYLDCPVLGRPNACGSWTLPTGGDAQFIDIARPVLEVLAAKIIPMGPSGHGNIVKLLNNLMFGAINSITCEVFALSAQMGLRPEVFFETVANSGAGTVSGLFKELGSKITSREFSPVFSIDNMHKDVGLGIAMAQQAGMHLPVSEANQRINILAREAGLGRQDTAAVLKIFENTLIDKEENQK